MQAFGGDIDYRQALSPDRSSSKIHVSTKSKRALTLQMRLLIFPATNARGIIITKQTNKKTSRRKGTNCCSSGFP
jgi:hypothetical protein